MNMFQSLRTAWLRALAIAGLLFLLSSALLAHTGTLRGGAFDQHTKSPIASARITIDGTTLGAITDTTGTFIICKVPTGSYVATAVATGYKKISKAIVLADADTAEISFDFEIDIFSLEKITVTGDRSFSAASSTVLNAVDFELKPRETAQDMLRLVPGLFLSQHAGGGKAEQIFLRGFDEDHGTDIAISVDGVPVNMVSHGHGQGYADLHWLIPEVVQGMEVRKGSYYADDGDLATSGAVRFTTNDQLENNLIGLEGGMFGTFRYLTMLTVPTGSANTSAYVAGEFFHTDGYFVNPQNFNRYNLFGNVTATINSSAVLNVWASGFGSSWNASGQIPERAVAEGLISRFGSLDPSEGGTTSRQNLSATYTAENDNGKFLLQTYFTGYRFNLFSDFTFFLVDSVHGDEIEQDDSRSIIGLQSEYQFNGAIGNISTTTLFGSALRADEINTQLWHVEKQLRLSNVVNVLDHQRDMSFYVQEEFRFSPMWRMMAGVRGDYLIFDVEDQNHDSTHVDMSGFVTQTILNPKINVVFTPVSNWEFFANAGTGFHSNDARDVVAHPADPTLPRISSAEFGVQTFLFDRLHITASLWESYLQSELVYNGDNGETDASGPTRRVGVDAGARLKLIENIFADVDVNYAHGRFTDSADGHNFIPLAPVLTSTGGFTYRAENGFEAALRYRYMAQRPANEDNSVVTRPYTVVDAVFSYRIDRYLFGVTVENIFNVEWNEAQFDTESRLKGESAPVEELDFTPGTPRSVRASVKIDF